MPAPTSEMNSAYAGLLAAAQVQRIPILVEAKLYIKASTPSTDSPRRRRLVADWERWAVP